MGYLPALPTLIELQARMLRQVAGTLAANVARVRSGRLSGRGPDDFDGLILDACQRYGVDPALVKGVIHAESGFDPNAVSRAGAKGLMQLMDATAAGLGVSDSFDPSENVEAGVRYLSELIDRYQDEALALAAYNAGPGAVDRYGGIPPFAETQSYVPRVLAYRQQYGASWEA